jgi:hypothetical protein
LDGSAAGHFSRACDRAPKTAAPLALGACRWLGIPLRRRAMKRLVLLALAFSSLVSLHAEQAKFTVSGFTFTGPEGWKQVEPRSTMRKAQLEVPGQDGSKSAEVAFFFFGGGQGGDVPANVQRWVAQFSGGKDVQKVEEQEINGTKVTLVSTEGTMKASPFAGIPEDMPDAALQGAILEHPEGPVFIKMTGPAPLVKASKEKFLALVKSATEKK